MISRAGVCWPSRVSRRVDGLPDVWNRPCSLPILRSNVEFLLINRNASVQKSKLIVLVRGTYRQADLLPHLDAVHVRQIRVKFAQLSDGGLIVAAQRQYAEVPNRVVWPHYICHKFGRARIVAKG